MLDFGSRKFTCTFRSVATTACERYNFLTIFKITSINSPIQYEFPTNRFMKTLNSVFWLPFYALDVLNLLVQIREK
jgi:hypothetical protein